MFLAEKKKKKKRKALLLGGICALQLNTAFAMLYLSMYTWVGKYMVLLRLYTHTPATPVCGAAAPDLQPSAWVAGLPAGKQALWGWLDLTPD